MGRSDTVLRAWRADECVLRACAASVHVYVYVYVSVSVSVSVSRVLVYAHVAAHVLCGVLASSTPLSLTLPDDFIRRSGIPLRWSAWRKPQALAGLDAQLPAGTHTNTATHKLNETERDRTRRDTCDGDGDGDGNGAVWCVCGVVWCGV